MKTGLVLEGGGMRGLFTAGILDVFMENELEFDGACGTSAGAVFGCNIKSKQIGRVIRYNLKFGRDKRYASFRNLITTGEYFGREFAYDTVPYELDPFDMDTYMNNPMEFYICATDIESGEAVYHKSISGGYEDIDWMRASASMPLFAKPVEIDGRLYMDGGLSDSVPIRFMEDMGYEKNLVILTRDTSYRKGPNKLMPLLKKAYKKYPNMLKLMENRHNDYNEAIRYIHEKEAGGSVYVMAPYEPLDISRISKDPKELKRVYKIGRKTAQNELEKIKEFLAK